MSACARRCWCAWGCTGLQSSVGVGGCAWVCGLMSVHEDGCAELRVRAHRVSSGPCMHVCVQSCVRARLCAVHGCVRGAVCSGGCWCRDVCLHGCVPVCEGLGVCVHGAASALVSARDACAHRALFVHGAVSASTRAQRCARRGCEFARVVLCACVSVCMKWVQWVWGQGVCMHAGPPHSFPSSAPLGVPACLRPPAHFWGPLILGRLSHIGPSRAAEPEDWISLHGCNAGVGTQLTTPGGANLWLLFSNPDRLHCFVHS